jgi:antitoxin ParD1/3/4
MNVSLTSRFESLVHRLVESGRYSSASEVVRDGLRLLEEREQLREMKRDELQRLIREARESGAAIAWNLEEFKKETRERNREPGTD